MKKRVAYVHIGLPKTASTTIQYFLTHNRHALLKQGVLYPEKIAFSDQPIQLHRMLTAVLEPETTKNLENLRQQAVGFDVVQMLHDEVAAHDPHTIVLSSEAFSFMRHPERLRDALEPYDVKILIYLRRQDDFLASSYNQAIKSRLLGETFDEYVKRRRNICRYDVLLAKWETIFGRENISPAIYRDYTMPHGILQDLSQRIGVDAAKLYFPDHDANPALASSLLELKRRVNLLLEGESERICCQDMFEERSALLASKAPPAGDEIQQNILSRNRLLEPYREGNEQVKHHFFPARKSLFSEPGQQDALLPDMISVDSILSESPEAVAALVRKLTHKN